MATVYDIYVYDPSDVKLRVLSLGQVASAKFRLAENEVGDFEVTVPWKTNDIPLLLSPPNRIEFWRDGMYVFGGIVRRRGAKQDGKIPFYTCSGPSYMQWLADARMRSATGTADIAFSSDHLDDTMKLAVTNHVLDSVNYFLCASDSSLSTISEAYTATGYVTVLEALQSMAERATDTSFDIVRDDDGHLRFRTYTPGRGPDKSQGTASPVLFDLNGGNLLNAEWYQDGNKVVNALWGGGPGSKAARYIYPSTAALTDSQSILDWGRIEGFIDSGSDGTAATDKKVIEELSKQSKPEESVNFDISQFGRYKLGVDFDFGTKVTVMWPPVLTFSDRIMGMEVTLDSGQGVANVNINVGDTITGDSAKRAALEWGRFMREMRRTLSVQVRH